MSNIYYIFETVFEFNMPDFTCFFRKFYFVFWFLCYNIFFEIFDV